MKYKGPKIKISRQLGLALTAKAVRYMERRPHPPGEHGPLKRRASKISDYKRQLLEKQRLKAQYHLHERQLRNYVRKAARKKENTENALIQLLETRLDAVVLRAGFARSMHAARQYVSHGHIMVNGKWVNNSSRAVRPSEIVSVRPKSTSLACFEAAREEMVVAPPAYLSRSNEEMTVKLEHLPVREEVPVSCTVPLVIEYYSR
jgi:small subunit ribosomal protein S4